MSLLLKERYSNIPWELGRNANSAPNPDLLSQILHFEQDSQVIRMHIQVWEAMTHTIWKSWCVGAEEA